MGLYCHLANVGLARAEDGAFEQALRAYKNNRHTAGSELIVAALRPARVRHIHRRNKQFAEWRCGSFMRN